MALQLKSLRPERERSLEMASNPTLMTVICGMLAVITLLSPECEATLRTDYTGRPCLGETVTLTCTVTGDLLAWESTAFQDVDLVRGFAAINETSEPAPGFTTIVTDITPTTIMSTLSVDTSSSEFEDGLSVTCAPVGTETIQLAGIPSPPLAFNSSVVSRSVDSGTVSVQWDPPTDNGGRDDLSYSVTILPQAQLSPTVVTSPVVTVTDANYNVDYTVSVMATNCAGNSSVVQYTFRVVTCAEPVFNTGVTLRTNPPTVYIEGDEIMYGCPDTAATQSTCGSDRQWSPDTTLVDCPRIVTCDPPSPPANGSIVNNVTSPLPVGTMINYTCDAGLFPPGNQPSTCVARMMDGVWEPNPGEVVCSSEPFTCTVPDPPANGFVVQTSEITIVFGCDEGFSPQRNRTATCVAMDRWTSLPEEIMCMIVTVPTDTAVPTTPTASPIAPIVGGAVGGLLFLIVLIVIIIIVLLVVSKHNDKYRASEQGIELTEQSEGHYSETTHTGPRSGARQNRAPQPEVDGYNRIDRPLDAAPEAYDDVTLNSEPRVAVNSAGYSALNGDQGPPRLPGYGQLNNVATVEPVIYADLTPRGAKPANTAQVDQHRVDYADVDHIATQRRAATMPTSPVKPPPPALDKAAAADKLLNLDQALVQLRTVQPRWQELAGALRVPETYIQQVEDMYRSDHASAMTEVVDYWMRSCSGKPTWRELADALRMIKEDHLAQQLMGIYETGRLPVELDMNEVPPDMYKYDNAPPPPVPTRSPTMNETDSPGLSRTLPARPPRHNNAPPAPLRPPKPASKDEFALPPRPPKPPPKH